MAFNETRMKGLASAVAVRSVIAATLTALALTLAGCGGGSGPPAAFSLSAPPAGGGAGAARSRTVLAVSQPTMLDPYTTERIVVMPVPGEIAHFGNAQWSDTLPRLLQSRLVQTFEASRRLRAVGKAGDGLNPSHTLVLDVRQFHLAVASRTADVELSAKIVTERDGRVVASRNFRNSVPVEATDGPTAAVALDGAFGQVASQMVVWFDQSVR